MTSTPQPALLSELYVGIDILKTLNITLFSTVSNNIIWYLFNEYQRRFSYIFICESTPLLSFQNIFNYKTSRIDSQKYTYNNK